MEAKLEEIKSLRKEIVCEEKALVQHSIKQKLYCLLLSTISNCPIRG